MESNVRGIYRYKLNGKIVYIGKAQDIRARIYQHTRELEFYDLYEVEYLPIPNLWVNSLEYNYIIEQYLINKYKPPINVVVSKQYEKRLTKQQIENVVSIIKYKRWIKYDEPIVYREPYIKRIEKTA